MIDCPYDGTKNIDGAICPQCKTDLTPLLRLQELPDLCYSEGMAFLESGNVDQAIERFLATSALNSSSVQLSIALADAYERKGRHRDAIAALAKAIEIEPTNQEAIARKHSLEEAVKQEENAARRRIRRQGIRKKMFMALPLLTFVLGIMVFRQYQVLSLPAPPGLPEVAQEIQRQLSLNPLLSGFHLQVTVADQSILVAGSVARPEQKELVTRLANTIADFHPVDAHQLMVSPEPEFFPYVVRRGDNLETIARHFYGSRNEWGRIMNTNRERIARPEQLRIGQVILIPAIVGNK